MDLIKHFLLSEHTNKLYENEGRSSIALTKEVADKINELVDAYNAIATCNLEKHQELEGTVRGGILYMKDHLINAIHDMFETLYKTGDLQSIIDNIYTSQVAENKQMIDWLKIFSSPQMFGAVGDGKTNDTKAIQKAIDNSKFVYLPEGVYSVEQLKVKTDTFIMGCNATIKCLPVSSTGNDATIIAEFTDGKIENVNIEGVVFEGNRSKMSNPYYDVIGVFALNGETVKDITISDCKFLNFKEDAIRFMYSKDANVSNITIENCIFDGVTNDKPSLNAIRFVMDSYVNTYGFYPVSNVFISNCHAHMNRTLVDLKRGCKNVVAQNLFTHNMNDCHNSVDGCKNVILTGIISVMDDDFTPTTGTNFVELQGEDITLQNLIGDGKTRTRDGVQVTDYGHVDENGVGHISKNIIIDNCKIENVYRNGFNIMNGDNVHISNCSIRNAGAHSYAFTSGDGRNDANGNKLVGVQNHLSNSTQINCKYGITAKNLIDNGIVLKVENVKNEYGFLPLYNSETQLQKYPMDIVRVSPLNLNPHLLTDADIPNHYALSNVLTVNSSDVPIGAYNAIRVIDSNNSKLGEMQCGAKFKAKKNDTFTFAISAKKVDSNYFALLIKEYNGLTWVQNTFITSPYLGDGWEDYIAQCTVKNDATDNIVVCLIPCAGYNNPTATGELLVSNFEVHRV